MRCRWCGRFVPMGTEPSRGLDRFGEPVEQVLCPEHARSWARLAALNLLVWPSVLPW